MIRCMPWHAVQATAALKNSTTRTISGGAMVPLTREEAPHKMIAAVPRPKKGATTDAAGAMIAMQAMEGTAAG